MTAAGTRPLPGARSAGRSATAWVSTTRRLAPGASPTGCSCQAGRVARAGVSTGARKPCSPSADTATRRGSPDAVVPRARRHSAPHDRSRTRRHPNAPGRACSAAKCLEGWRAGCAARYCRTSPAWYGAVDIRYRARYCWGDRAVSEPEDDVYCNENHRQRGRPCDHCLLQRKTLRDLRLLKEGKPTLTHQPFASLLRRIT